MTAQERKDFRRVQRSRETWKTRAVQRGEDRRRFQERRKEVERSRDMWRDRALTAERRVVQLTQEQLLHKATPPMPPLHLLENTHFF